MSKASPSASVLSYSVIQLLLAILFWYMLEDEISIGSLQCHTDSYISHMD